MNGRHIQVGLLFVGVCVLIGLAIAFFTTHHVSIDSGNSSTAVLSNATQSAAAAPTPAPTEAVASDFLVTDQLRRHKPTFENVGEGPTAISFCAGGNARIANGSATRLNLKVVGAEGDFSEPLGSIAAGQTLKFDAGEEGT